MVCAVFSVSDMKVCMPGFRTADLEGAGMELKAGDERSMGEGGEVAV
jgi:hypothetical protein